MAFAPLHLAAALDGAGWHPAAWREPAALPGELFTGRYWTELIQEAERGLLDFVTIEDAHALHASAPDARTDQVRGRLDAVLIAARVAPLTRTIGLIPTASVTHTEPFHLSKAIASLDFAARGRAGVRIKVAWSAYEASLFGRRRIPQFSPEEYRQPHVRELIEALFDEAADVVEVLRRLWDSWEDDAEIRDAATGRFIDRDKLHYIDFEGRWFNVKGPSITPRPPQGQPLITTLAHDTVPYRLAARAADVVYVTPADWHTAQAIVAQVRAEQAAAGREHETLHVFGDVVVFLGKTAEQAEARKQRLDELAGEAYASDAHIFTGTPAQLADLLLEWQAAGLSGFRLRPGAIPDDLAAITGALVPELQRRGAFRTAYAAATLRGHLGLPRPANRYAAAGAAS
jgi:alkanesulfonate monooxygenase SsuD/methylene tetrahydromethanopterin reductase-like flavin-dependent oxidoreductase (luciferase family)